MNVKKLATLEFLMVLFLVVSCGKRASKQGDTFGSPIKSYDASTFARFPTFQGKIVEKYIDFPEVLSGQTNYHVVIILEKNNEDKFVVTQNHAPQNVVDVVNSLQEGHSYIFPSALTNGKAESISH